LGSEKVFSPLVRNLFEGFFLVSAKNPNLHYIFSFQLFCAMKISLLLLLFLLIIVEATSQTIPTIKRFQPISTHRSHTLPRQTVQNPLLLMQLQQQQRIRQQNQMGVQRALPQALEPEDTNELYENRYLNPREAYKSLNYSFPPVREQSAGFYENALTYFEEMLSGDEPLSLKNAVYLVENAYFENTMPYRELDETLRNAAYLIALKMKEQQMPNTDLAKNLAIYQFMADTFRVKIPHQENRIFTHTPFQYDFEDYKGERDHRQLFVSKLLQTHSGQCHSLPLLYLLLAEELGAEAWLSYSPNHTFIKFKVNGRLQNYETTNRHFVSDAFVMQSGFIRAEALANRVYMGTLSKKQLIAHCLMDLAMGYEHKYGYNEFSLKCAELTLKYHPNNITAWMTKANYYGYLLNYVFRQSQERRLPNMDLRDIPEAKAIYDEMVAAQQKLEALGYAEMPEEVYNAWLRSVEQETGKSQRAVKQIQQSLWKK
jgi:hypothetical protein